MLRPYTFFEKENPTDVVGHHDEGVQARVRDMQRYVSPHARCDLPHPTEMHNAFENLAEQARAI